MLKVIEKQILITFVSEDTPYFLIFSFFEIFRGFCPPMAPHLIMCGKHKST